MKRAVIYCRVSTKDQVDNFSLATQEKQCRDYCDRNGFVVDRLFVEQGESAKTANRTEFQKMLSYCRQNKNSVLWVVVYSVSRFARSVHDHAETRKHLATLGITLRSVTEPFDESPTGRCMENMLSVFAQFDNDVRADRTVAGMKAAIEAGKWTFTAPLGYLNGDGKNDSPSLIHDPKRGPLVKQAFELFATGGHTARKVLDIVTAAGLLTKHGKPVSAQTFCQMLRKPIYAGRLVVKGWGECKRGDFEPLVSQNIFDRVQALLDGKLVSVTPHKRNHPDFPLRHFVKCGCCGRPLTGSWSTGRSKRYPYYACPNSLCRGVSVSKADLENRFVAYLERMQPEPRYVKLFNEIVLDVWKEKQAQNLTLSVSLRQRIEELHARRERVEEAYAQERAIDHATYMRQHDKLNEQILLAEIQERDAKLEGCDVDAVLAFAEHLILNAARLWTEFSSDQKQRLQKVLFPESVTFADGVFGTAVTCPLFKLLEKPEGEKSGLVGPAGFEPATKGL
jgi:site-specific DNA recombinase